MFIMYFCAVFHNRSVHHSIYSHMQTGDRHLTE